MYISVNDLNFLKGLLEKIEKVKSIDFLEDYITLYWLIVKLSEQHETMNDRVKLKMRERRKIDKNYGRGKR